VNNPFFYTENHFPNKFVVQKKSRGGVGDTLRMTRMKTMYNPLMDHHGLTHTSGQRRHGVFFFPFFESGVGKDFESL
jgi:hypothetical protein